MFGVLIGLMVALYLVRPSILPFVWSISVFVFPTTRTMIGPAPIYWYDVVTVALFGVVWYETRNRWPTSVVKWHWIMIGCSAVFGLLFPVIRYGPSAELLYLWIHMCIAWMCFPIGILIFRSVNKEGYIRSLVIGVALSAVTIAMVGVYQKGGPDAALAVNVFFRGDMGGMWTESEYGLFRYWQRPNGPFGAATTFAGVAAIMALVASAAAQGAYKRWVSVTAAAALAVVVVTLTRHVLIAALVGSVVVVASSSIRQKVKVISAVGISIGVIATIGLGMGWDNRFSVWNTSGFLADESVAARLLVGPARLVQLLASDPAVFITGVGLDVQKLASSGVDVGISASGFVSNGFLLALYYLGIVGFACMVSFWIWTFRRASRFSGRVSSWMKGLVAVAILIVVSDNYSFMEETAVSGLFLFAGCVVGAPFAIAANSFVRTRPAVLHSQPVHSSTRQQGDSRISR